MAEMGFNSNIIGSLCQVHLRPDCK